MFVKPLLDLTKLEPLDGTNFKRWNQKMMIFFEQLEMEYVLIEDAPTAPTENAIINLATPAKDTDVGAGGKKAVDPALAEKMKKYESDNKSVRGHLLSHVTNPIFDLLTPYKSAKAMWELLGKKYGADDAGKKKYVCGKFMQFKMVDNKPIMEQVHEYENLVADILSEGMQMCAVLQANFLIEKLPDSWSSYRNHLKHKKKDLTLEELVSHMNIEEANRLKDKPKAPPAENSVRANLAESVAVADRFKKGESSSGPKKDKKGPTRPTNQNFKKQGKPVDKSKQGCYVCGKPGHRAYQCYNRKDDHKGPPKPNGGQPQQQANVAETGDNLTAMITEANFVGNKVEWLIDTGATKHFCADRELFAEFVETSDIDKVYMGNSSVSQVLGKGKVALKLTSGKTLTLLNVLFVPSLRRNLISSGLLEISGLKQVIEGGKLVLTKNGDFVGKTYRTGTLYVLETVTEIENNKNVTTSAYYVESIDLWHARLGHVNAKSLNRLHEMGLIPKLNGHEKSMCEICVESKYRKRPFKSVVERSTELLELIHSDLAVFKDIESRGGKRYYITFVDDYSRYTKLYLLRSKDEAENTFYVYKAEVENQLNRKIKRLRSDRGGEYVTNSLKEYCEINGIIHEFTAPYCPQQNCILERKNRTLKEMMNALLASSDLPDNMWGEAVLSVNHILNKVPHKKLDKTPYELWKGHPPNLKLTKVWGCLAKVGLPSFKVDGIGSKTFDVVMIGYAENSSAYHFMCLGDRSLCEYRDAVFFEHVFPLKKNNIQSGTSSSTIASSSLSLPDIHNDEPRRSKRQKTGTSYGPDFITAFLIDLKEVDELDETFINLYMIENDPTTYEEAISSLDATFWKDAINSELESIMTNHTWELVDLPKGNKAIGSK